MTSDKDGPPARRWESLLALAVLAAALAASSETVRAESAADILKTAGSQGGLVVHLGCAGGKLTAALRASRSYLVHGLDTDAANVAKAREHIRSLDLYGPVSAAPFDGEHLPYADNLVNLVVAEDLGKVPMEEVLRVLAPLGVALVGGKKTVKPWPQDIDQWQQYLHDADNNAVAHDTVVGPPRHLQCRTWPSRRSSAWCRPGGGC